jgi:hypothetical protein
MWSYRIWGDYETKVPLRSCVLMIENHFFMRKVNKTLVLSNVFSNKLSNFIYFTEINR